MVLWILIGRIFFGHICIGGIFCRINFLVEILLIDSFRHANSSFFFIKFFKERNIFWSNFYFTDKFSYKFFRLMCFGEIFVGKSNCILSKFYWSNIFRRIILLIEYFLISNFIILFFGVIFLVEYFWSNDFSVEFLFIEYLGLIFFILPFFVEYVLVEWFYGRVCFGRMYFSSNDSSLIVFLENFSILIFPGRFLLNNSEFSKFFSPKYLLVDHLWSNIFWSNVLRSNNFFGIVIVGRTFLVKYIYCSNYYWSNICRGMILRSNFYLSNIFHQILIDRIFFVEW